MVFSNLKKVEDDGAPRASHHPLKTVLVGTRIAC